MSYIHLVVHVICMLVFSARLPKLLPKRAPPIVSQIGCMGLSCRSVVVMPPLRVVPHFLFLHALIRSLQRLRDGERLLPGRQWYLLVEDARGIGITADSVQIMLLKIEQAMASRCVVRHIVESRSKEKLCMLTTQWVASVADAPFKSKVDVIDVHGKHMHGNVSYDAKAGSCSAWKATLFAMPGFTEMTVEPLVQRFPTLRSFMQHAREVGQQRAVAELAGELLLQDVLRLLQNTSQNLMNLCHFFSAELKCGSTGQRRLGPVRAQRLLTAFTSKDTSLMFGPHTEGL